MPLINLKVLPKFHVARPNRSRVISKNLKFRRSLSLVEKWPSKNKETRDASVGRSNDYVKISSGPKVVTVG